MILLGLPIGNLSDITKRTRDALQSGEIFIAEDTRNLKKIFNALSIQTDGKDFVAYFDQSSQAELDRCMKELNKGRPVYVVSDAGSPYISDPGFPLVREAYRLGHKVDSLPGPTAPMVALELSGLPPIPFHFHGFLPRKEGEILDYIKPLAKGTHIFFESPNRFRQSVKVILELVDRVCICRELTKLYQSCYWIEKASPESLSEIPELGEVVVLFHLQKVDLVDPVPDNLKELANLVIESQGHPKKVAKLVAEILHKKVDDIYQSLHRK